MRKIKFNLSTTNKPLSSIIRGVQKTDFSHCSVEYSVMYFGTTMVYEAKGLSSYVINKAHFDGEIVHSYEAEVSDENYYRIMQYIHTDAGVPYAWKSLFGFLLMTLAKVFGLTIRNPWPEEGKICSESVGDILVLFFGVIPDVHHDDMDLVWVKEKLDGHPSIKKVEIT